MAKNKLAPNTVLKTFKIDGRDIDVTLTDAGEFYARPEEFNDGIKADTLKGLEKKLREKLRRSALRVTVEATQLVAGRWSDDNDPIHLEPVLITGVHGSTHNLLLKHVTTGESEQVRSYHDGGLLRRLTQDEATKLYALDKARRESKAAYEAAVAELRINGKDELEKATALAERPVDPPK